MTIKEQHGIKVPSEWLRKPHFETRTLLLESRKIDNRMNEPNLHLHTDLAQDIKKFNRTRTLFRDCYHKNGVFDDFRGERVTNDSNTSLRIKTRSSLILQRIEHNRTANLKFEPRDIQRLRDVPDGSRLQEWWKQLDGYVENVSSIQSQHVDFDKEHPLQHAKKINCRINRRQITEKVTEISHFATLTPHCSPKPHEMQPLGLSESNDKVIADGQFSPIKPPRRKVKDRARGTEHLFHESTSQRLFLEQMKHNTTKSKDTLSINSALLKENSTDSKQKDVHDSRVSNIRCGGFD